MAWTVPRTSLCPLQYLIAPLGLSSRRQIEQPHGNSTKQDWVSLWESLHRVQRALGGSAWSRIMPIRGLDFTEESVCLQESEETGDWGNGEQPRTPLALLNPSMCIAPKRVQAGTPEKGTENVAKFTEPNHFWWSKLRRTYCVPFLPPWSRQELHTKCHTSELRPICVVLGTQPLGIEKVD